MLSGFSSVEARRLIGLHRQRLLQEQRISVAAIVILVVLSLVGALTIYRLELLNQAENVRIHFDATVAAIDKRLHSYVSLVKGVQGLFSSSHNVTEEEFRNYLSVLNLSKNFPGTATIEFIETTSSDTQYTTRMAEPFFLSGAEAAKIRLPDAHRQKVYERARDSGEIALASEFTLSSNSPASASNPAGGIILIVAPLYAGSSYPGNISERRRSLSGFIAGTFRMDAVLAEIPPGIPIAARLIIREKNADHEASIQPKTSTQSLSSRLINRFSPIALTKRYRGLLTARDSTWHIELQEVGSATYLSRPGAMGVSILVFCLLITVVVGRLLHKGIQGRRAMLELTAELTDRLGKTGALLDSIIDNVPVMIFAKEPETLNLRLWNRAAEAITGVNRFEILGRNGLEIFPKDQVDDYLTDDREVLSSGKLSVRTETITPPGKSTLLLRTKKILLRGEDGRPRYLLGVSEDVTEQARRAREDLIDQKLKAVGSLASGIAHEINGPAQYVSLNLSYLNEHLDNLLTLNFERGAASAFSDKEQRELRAALEESIAGVTRIAEIVKAMRDFSHPGTKAPQATNINELIQSTVTVAKHTWKHCAEVRCDLDQSLPSTLAYPGELGQAILNLLINAAQAIEESGEEPLGLISVRTFDRDDCVTIEIEDTGAGIPEEILPRIFDPFFTTKPVGRGSGQGLPISHSIIVDKHRGQISVRSTTGKGTCFTISLPKMTTNALEASHEVSIC